MILITGGGGFYGRNIARNLVDRGKNVLLVQRSPIKVPPFLAPFWDKQVKGVRGDITSLPFLMDLVKTYDVESIIHLAVDANWRKDTPLYQVMQVNIQGTINVLEAARIFAIRRVTFASSNTVYSRAKNTSIDSYHEDLDLPVTDIGYISSSKRAGENICLLYSKEYDLSVCMIRGGRGYGPGSHQRNMPLDAMVPDALEGKPLDLTRLAENSTIAPCYSKDLAKGYCLVHLAESPQHYIYNISSGSMYTLSEVAQIVTELIPGAEIKLGPAAPDVVPYRPSIERAKQDVGFIPDYPDVKQGIIAYIDYLKEEKY